MTTHYTEIDACVDHIIATAGPRLVVGTPLGLGKANLLLNALYQRVKNDADLDLTIFTALSLQKPHASSELERRLVSPMFTRWFDGYPELDYVVARSRGKLPDNIRVHEFFFSPGKFLRNELAQRDYINTNYTHVARDMLSRGVNVVVQMVSPGQDDYPGRLSLSCNPDVTLELIPKMRAIAKATDQPVIAVGEINEALPFMLGDASVPEDFFDALYVPPEKSYTLFAPPKSSVSLSDHLIGLHASSLVRDDGTLQVGIGALGDAVAYALGMRHEENESYQTLISAISTPQCLDAQKLIGGVDEFAKGLYGATEMFVDGFLHLFDKQILKRRVYDDLQVQTLLNEGKISEEVNVQTLHALEQAGAISFPLTQKNATWLQRIGVIVPQATIDKHLQCNGKSLQLPALRDVAIRFIEQHALGTHLADPTVMHGGFYLGDGEFYQRLRDLEPEQRGLLKMTSVDRINQLYRGEALDRLQRRNARFINSCLMVTLNGAVVSDGLEDNRVVSGVGGQYNFVAMAHALDQSRSIIKCRSTYAAADGLRSNIVMNYGHCTIPRHLRDVVVTEYGVADLRGRSDRECAQLLINIADSRFQADLLKQVKAAGKVPADYQIPEAYRNNTPERLREITQAYADLLPAFPLGTDLTEHEQKLGKALKRLSADSKTFGGKIRIVKNTLTASKGPDDDALMKRMGFDQVNGWRTRWLRRMVRGALNAQ